MDCRRWTQWHDEGCEIKTMPGLSAWWRKKGWDSSRVLKDAEAKESMEAIEGALEALESKNLGIE